MEIIAYQVRQEVAIVVFGKQTRIFRKIAKSPASFPRELTTASELHSHLQNASILGAAGDVTEDYSEALAACFNIVKSDERVRKSVHAAFAPNR